MLPLLGLWVVLSIAVAMLAYSRGRDRVTWLLISLLISPLLATALLLSTRDLAALGAVPPRPAGSRLVWRIVANLVMAAAVIAILASLMTRGGMKPVRLSQDQSIAMLCQPLEPAARVASASGPELIDPARHPSPRVCDRAPHWPA